MAWNFRGETTIDNKYSDSAGYQTAYQQLFDQLASLNSDSEQARQGQAGALTDVANQFNSLWTNLVGRAPTSEETDSFLSSNAGSIITSAGGGTGRVGGDSVNIRNQIAQYVGDTGAKAAQDYATTQLQGQQGEANRLSELFRSQGRTAISDTEGKLLDYQQRLFERLRPNLITSLQAQGLLNTGALNESLAGAAKDLSDASQSTLLDMNYQNEQGANAIAYGGQSAPYAFQQQQIMSQPGYLQAQGGDALNRAFQTFSQNLDFRNQAQLINLQARSQPRLSFFDTFGQSLATAAGQAGGEAMNPKTYYGKK
jgi:hypothetical protein